MKTKLKPNQTRAKKVTNNLIANKHMGNHTSHSTTTSKSGKQPQEKSGKSSMKSSQLMKLFEDQLKDIYWAEKALKKALPAMIKNASSSKLVDALKSHLTETEKQVTRLEQVFESIDKKASAKKCDAMDGLIKESEEIMESCEEGAMCDAGIISAGQKVEHYEIATYGTLRQFAETLGLTEAVSLLEATLKEEKAADRKLSELAMDAINLDAARAKA
ncbi:MAG: ferritin-like domain-containing protein [Rhodothermaceae bacterium]|nr:ferritin-like domain-containing protein [Rhodothermaceae bacterium]